jgi:hypothetical protein
MGKTKKMGAGMTKKMGGGKPKKVWRERGAAEDDSPAK